MTRLTFSGDYTDDWPQVRYQVYERAGWRCEHCGMEFLPGDTRARFARNANGAPMILTVHHINGDKSDNRPANLLACCQVCHLHIQAVWRPGGVLPAHWEQPPRWIIERDLPYVRNGQLSLWGA